MDTNMLIYNGLDSCCTEQCRLAFWDELKDGYIWTYEQTKRLLGPLMYMSTRGLRVDFEELSKTKVDVLEQRDKLQEELNRLCGRSLNVNSPKDCQQYFYVEKGIKPYYNRKTGSVTTDDLAMQRMAKGTAARSGLREASLVQKIRALNKLYGTYLDIEFDEDGRLRCSYNPRGTKFGRLSSSATVFGTGTNLQNLPEEFKRFCVADEDCFYVNIDKRQAEWVVVAYLSGDANMLHVIENNLDPHTSTARMMFAVEEALVKEEAKYIGSSSDREFIRDIRIGHFGTHPFFNWPKNMSLRQCGKKSNHGLNYDEGYRTFALMNEFEEPESRRIIDLYHKTYPGIRQWHAAVRHQLQKDRTLTNCFGRKIKFMDAWGDDLFKAAYSAIPQSTVVDGLDIGMCEIYEDNWLCGKNECNGEVMAQVHDSILLQFPTSVLSAEGGTLFHRIMKDCYGKVSPEMEYSGRRFTINTDMKVGLNWGTYHPGNQRGMVEVVLGDDPVQFCNDVYAILKKAQESRDAKGGQ